MYSSARVVYISPVPHSKFPNQLAFVSFIAPGRRLNDKFPKRYRTDAVPLFEGDPRTIECEIIIYKEKRNH